MSEFHVVHEEPGANSTCLHAEIDRGGLERSRKVVFWMDPGVKVNCYALITLPEKQVVSEK